jgi:hypothetical protein
VRLGGVAAKCLLPALAVLAGCATSTPQPRSRRSPDADFSAYRTFALPETPGIGDNDRPLQLLDRDIRAAIAGQMRLKGYVESSDQPDLMMSYETANANRVANNPVRVGIGVGSWGGNFGGSINVGSPSVRNYKEGTLVIHAVDTARNAEVWVGTLSERLNSGSLESTAVASAVAEVMKDFPARPAGQ